MNPTALLDFFARRSRRSNPESCLSLTSFLPAALLLAITVFHAATVREGHIWGDDFALYMAHARNIVEGRPYAETGYLWEPASQISPKMYPPLFPLLLAPIYRSFGLSLIPMKLEQVAFFVLALAVVYQLWRRDLGSEYGLAMVGILGFSPHFWAAKDNVLSDLPFLLFFYVATALVEYAPRETRPWWCWAVLVGASLYAATGTRTAGIALLAGLVLYDLLKFRTITKLTGVALLTWSSLLTLQTRIMGSGLNSYSGHFHPTSDTIMTNLISYPRALAGFWVASLHNAFSFFVLFIVLILTLAGLRAQYRRGISSVEAFLIPFGTLTILWPFSGGIRLVLPFVPWIVFIALLGLRTLSEKIAPGYVNVGLCGLLLVVSVPFIVAYRNTDFGPIRESTGLPEFNQLCQAVREQTRPEDVVIYYRARALALYTDRKASAYNRRGTDEELWEYARRIHATHLITSNAFEEDHGFLARAVANQPSALALTYQNDHFKLYKILPTAETLSAATH